MERFRPYLKSAARCAVVVLGISAGIVTSDKASPVVSADPGTWWCDAVPIGCSSYGCTADINSTMRCDLASNPGGPKSCGSPACKSAGLIE